MLYTSCRLLAVGIVASLLACSSDAPTTSREGSVPADQALATFELEPGFKMELVVHEPLISSPVDMEVDEYGRMFVVEMPGYPLDNTHTGRIKLLTDTDQDGVFDKSQVFAEKLRFPNGIMRWKKGVIVTDAPYVFYFEDADNDGLAEKCDTLLTGFSLSNPHVNVNNPIYGLDNWIYLSHFGHIGTRKYEDKFGDKGEEITFWNQPNAPKLPVNANAKSVRFHPDKQQLELTAVRGQFGHSFDTWGRHFLTHNQNHIYHEAIGAQYLQRNPNLVLANAGANISDHGNETEVFQITTHPDRQLFTPVGLTTSSSGMTVYTGGAFGDLNEHTTFVCESVSNLVHIDLIEENGATFKAKRHRDGKEFLASKDSWSRPVNLYIGPDGALYVIDYYRRIIEHPEWMSDEAVAAGGLSDGQDMGRIYRITKEGAGAAEWIKGLQLGDATSEELVHYLGNQNSWWRTHAQRLLVDREDTSVIPLLSDIVTNASESVARLHALWTLKGLNALDEVHILAGLKDKEAGVRENAIKLAELSLQQYPDLIEALYALQSDANPKVRFQLLCTLGSVETSKAAQIRETLLFRDLQDEWVQVAALSANVSQTTGLLDKVLARFKPNDEAYAGLVRRLATMAVATGDVARIEQLLVKGMSTQKSSPGLQVALLGGLEEGLRRQKVDNAVAQNWHSKLVSTYLSHPESAVNKGILGVLRSITKKDVTIAEQQLNQAISIASSKDASEPKRLEALRLLALGDVQAYEQPLQKLLQSDESGAIKAEALQALAKVKGTALTEQLLSNWETLSPDLREVALESFLTENERVALLLHAVEKKEIGVAAIGWRRSVQLMNNGDELLRDKARKLLTQKPSDELLKGFQQVLESEGDIENGKIVYAKHCALCHQVRGSAGISFGPDLGTVHNWLARDLLANIIEPNLSIAQGYDLWEVTLKNGEQKQGMIMTQTASTINLRMSPGNEMLINRQDIEQIKSMSMSLMPSLAEQITPSEMANLIAYLRNSYQ